METKKTMEISLTAKDIKQLKKEEKIQKQLFLHLVTIKYKKTTRGRKPKEN